MQEDSSTGRIVMVSPILGSSGRKSSRTIREMLLTAGFEVRDVGESEVEPRTRSRVLRRVSRRFPFYEVSVMCRLASRRREREIVFFHIGAPSLLLGILISRVMGMRTVILVAGSESRSVLRSPGEEKSLFASRIGYIYFRLRELMCFSLATRLIVYEPSLVAYFGLGRWKDKTKIAGPLPVDTCVFSRRTAYSDRPEVVGYVGRLSEEKGVADFVRALPFLFAANATVRAQIVGDGPLRKDLSDLTRDLGVHTRVDFIGWVETSRVAELLNGMRLCVIPSRTDAVPTIMLQSMACGTPVLATRVGGMQDTLSSGNLGFLIEALSPQSLGSEMSFVLKTADLAEMSDRISAYVKNNFGMVSASARFRNAITSNDEER